MKNSFLFLIILFIASCSSEKDEKIQSALKQFEVDTMSIDIDTVAIKAPIIEEDTTLKVDIINDSAFYKKGRNIIAGIHVKPLVQLSEEGPREIRDEVYFLAGCMVHLIDLESAGHFCHTPSIKEVDIYTQNGEKKVITSKSQTSIFDNDITSDFNGNKFSSPKDDWATIVVEAEGMIFGFLILQNDGTFKEIYLKEQYPFDGEISTADFNENNDLVWPKLTLNNEPVKLVLNKNGEYWIE